MLDIKDNFGLRKFESQHNASLRLLSMTSKNICWMTLNQKESPRFTTNFILPQAFRCNLRFLTSLYNFKF